MEKYINKLVKIKTIYGDEIIGIVIQKPILVLYLKTISGIFLIDCSDIEDIILIGE